MFGREYTYEELRDMILDSVVAAECSNCGCEHRVEPDASGYDCSACGAEGTVTSPLIIMGLM